MTLPGEFKALVVTETPDNQFVRSMEQKKVDDLPEGDVTVQVLYSSLNYKDVLSATGNRGVLGTNANGNRIDIGKVYAERRQVDYPLFPSGKLRRGSVIVVDDSGAV